MPSLVGRSQDRSRAEQTTVFRQAYISRTVKDFPTDYLDDLEKQSRLRSQRLGINSLVVLIEGRVIHIMEGKEKMVRRMMQRIKRDDRHHQLVSVFSEHANQQKLLRDSSLVIRDLSDVPQDMLKSLRQMISNFQWAQSNPELKSSQIGFLKSLALFSFKRPITSKITA